MAVLARRAAGANSRRRPVGTLLHVTGQVTLRRRGRRCDAIAGALAAAGAPVEQRPGRSGGASLPGHRRARDPCSSNPTRASWRPTSASARSCEAGDFELRTGARGDGAAPRARLRSPSRRPTGTSLRGRHRRRLRRPGRARARSAVATGRGGRRPRCPRWPTSRRADTPATHAARLHRVGRRHDLRPAGPRRRPARRHLQGVPPHAGPGPRRLRSRRPRPARRRRPCAPRPPDRRGARACCPSLDPEPVATERCVYDNSADADFVLDRVGRVVVGCGTSGHAFKFGPLLGRAAGRPGRGRASRRSTWPLRPRPASAGPRPGDGPRWHPGRLRTCPATSPCSGASTSPATAASPWTSCAPSFDALGYTDVTTYIQTGNVLFSTGSKSESGIAAAIEQRLAEDFGDSPAVLLRSVADLQRVGTASPYAKAGADPARHHVTFLATAPPKAALRRAGRSRRAAATSSSSTAGRSTCTRPTATPRRSTPAPSWSAGSASSARPGTGTRSPSSASWPVADRRSPPHRIGSWTATGRAGGHRNGRQAPAERPGTARPTLNTAVLRRRADRAFSLRLATAIRQQGRALERLKR